MRTDLYTKFVLTVIAIALIYLCGKVSEPTASARSQHEAGSATFTLTDGTPFTPVGLVGHVFVNPVTKQWERVPDAIHRR